ncbi:Serine/threonine protein kinase [Handroanthus impetiginosus]|uniref:Serine/threonine protein kinase n=1 Tax=Handroanthus impetiginosus TaxID=429701 RepID=A0A2G9GTX3_9LAMI|nr:Serine/threonine protein kinase [Handroanthus impetiginosus]
MSDIYDNWEKLVRAVLRKEQLWQLFHAHSRSPSILSESSDASSSSHLSSPSANMPFDFLSSSSYSREEYFEVPNKLVFTAKFTRAFGIEDLFKASTGYLGKGMFGSVYKATLYDMIVVVMKRLKPVNVSEVQFRRRMEIIGNIRDENVVALKGYYSYKEEKIILYEYYCNGSVSQLLHGKTGENQAHVDWPTRLRIAIGAARGIAHIHTQIGGKLVHGNIRSSNVFINPQRYGCISDIGLAAVKTTTFTPAIRCYAPEDENTRNVSQESDVYSFGVFLLELVTRTSPIAFDLVKWVNSVEYKEWNPKVVDIDLLKNNSAIKEQIVKTLEVGMSCGAKSPERRPKMSAVVKMIEDISMMNTEKQVSTGRKISGTLQ